MSSSNIRAKSIEGHVTDSAGNVLRNSKIVIKQATPGGSFVVDTTKSDDSGYFISAPLPDGVYDIYESGIRVAKNIHSSDKNAIQSFKANPDNYDVVGAGNFEVLAEELSLNNFKAFIQIEPAEIDIPQYGNTFPLYDFIFSNADPEISGSDNDLWNLSQFFGFNNESRITTTRFDVEYYNPLTALSNSYQRTRWSGVPAIKFYKDSKLLIPLDYFSMTLNLPKVISPSVGQYSTPGQEISAVSESVSSISLTDESGTNNEFQTLIENIKKGDVLSVIIEKDAEEAYYGIVTKVETSPKYSIILEKLLSSNYTSVAEPDVSGDYLARRILLYDGMFRGISEINEDVNEKFSVVENVYAQSIPTELYNYNGAV
jgi:hypothetical protein